MTARPLGRAKGPGEKMHTFLFVSPDADKALKTGEFIVYHAEVDGQTQPILARITERRPLRLYPDGFSTDPQIDPNTVAAMVGYTGKTRELFEITGEVIGYYDEKLRDFINPRVPPGVGTPIYLAENDYLSRVLSRVQPGRVGAATVGWLLSRSKGEVPVAVDVGAIASTHLAIIASTGAGKSYTASVLIEEMLKPNNRAAVLIIDPHGEYDTLDELPKHAAMRADDYRPEARIYKPGDVKIRVATLERGDLRYLLPNISERMEHMLDKAYRQAQHISRDKWGVEDRWTLSDLVQAVEEEGQKDDDAYNMGTARAVIWRLEKRIVVGEGQIFDDFVQTPLTELLQPGRCAVIQFSRVDSREQQVIVAALLRRVFYARMRTKNREVAEGDDFYLPYPVFVVVEEAHNFAPAGVDIVSTGILKTILAEGRKFGVGVGLISQRPGKLDPDVLSQCNTQVLLRIVNPVDIARVAESVESVGRELINELPALTKGQAIIAGTAVNTPVLCQIRERHTPHGAEDIPAPEEWISYFGKDQAQARAREAAPLQQPQRRERLVKQEDSPRRPPGRPG